MISVYADGSSSGGSNKPGGYGWVLVRDEQVLLWGYGGSPATTNNLMEAEGAICGLEALMASGLRRHEETVELVSDSQYTLGIASGAYAPSKNLDQAQRLKLLAQQAQVQRFRWVRGHNGDTFNEKCDQLARVGKEENTPAHLRKPKPQRNVARKERRRKIKDATRKATHGDSSGD